MLFVTSLSRQETEFVAPRYISAHVVGNFTCKGTQKLASVAGISFAEDVKRLSIILYRGTIATCSQLCSDVGYFGCYYCYLIDTTAKIDSAA